MFPTLLVARPFFLDHTVEGIAPIGVFFISGSLQIVCLLMAGPILQFGIPMSNFAAFYLVDFGFYS